MKNIQPQQSVPGPYSVNEECIACDACVLVAEKHFKIDEKTSCAYVYRQPQTQKEFKTCQEALETCPVEAIHYSGHHIKK